MELHTRLSWSEVGAVYIDICLWNSSFAHAMGCDILTCIRAMTPKSQLPCNLSHSLQIMHSSPARAPHISTPYIFFSTSLRTKFKLKIKILIFLLMRPTPCLPLVPPPLFASSLLHPPSTAASSLLLGSQDELRQVTAAADLAEQGNWWQRSASTVTAGRNEAGSNGGPP